MGEMNFACFLKRTDQERLGLGLLLPPLESSVGL